MAFRGRNAQCGIGVAEHTKNTFMELQRKKVHRYVVFKIDEKKKEVVVEKTGDQLKVMMIFLLRCRRMIVATLSPSVSRIRSKMLYATSKDRFRRELEGIHYEIQATDSSEVDLETLQDRAK
ncbi:Actin-depolymerizing factor 11 [Bienertia sinuspersici]